MIASYFQSLLHKLVRRRFFSTNYFWFSVRYVNAPCRLLIIPTSILTCSNTDYGTPPPLVTPNTDRAAARHGAPGVTPQLLGRVCGRHLSRGLLTRSCYQLSLLGSCILYSLRTRLHLALTMSIQNLRGGKEDHPHVEDAIGYFQVVRRPSCFDLFTIHRQVHLSLLHSIY